MTTASPSVFEGPAGDHIAAGSIAMQKARQRVTEILRILPGSSLVVAPSDLELLRSELSADFEAAFGDTLHQTGTSVAIDGNYIYVTTAAGNGPIENGTAGTTFLYIGQHLR